MCVVEAQSAIDFQILQTWMLQANCNSCSNNKLEWSPFRNWTLFKSGVKRKVFKNFAMLSSLASFKVSVDNLANAVYNSQLSESSESISLSCCKTNCLFRRLGVCNTSVTIETNTLMFFTCAIKGLEFWIAFHRLGGFHVMLFLAATWTGLSFVQLVWAIIQTLVCACPHWISGLFLMRHRLTLFMTSCYLLVNSISFIHGCCSQVLIKVSVQIHPSLEWHRMKTIFFFPNQFRMQLTLMLIVAFLDLALVPPLCRIHTLIMINWSTLIFRSFISTDIDFDL